MRGGGLELTYPRVPQFSSRIGGHKVIPDRWPERCDERVPNDYMSSFDHRCKFRWKYILERNEMSYHLCTTHYKSRTKYQHRT